MTYITKSTLNWDNIHPYLLTLTTGDPNDIDGSGCLVLGLFRSLNRAKKAAIKHSKVQLNFKNDPTPNYRSWYVATVKANNFSYIISRETIK